MRTIQDQFNEFKQGLENLGLNEETLWKMFLFALNN